MHLVVVVELGPTPLKMLNPVEACVLDLGGQVLFQLTTLNLGYKRTWPAHSTNILPEKARHDVDAASR